MKVKVILLILFITTSLVMFQSEAFISISIDREDLDHVTDFIHTITINEHPQPLIHNRKRRVIKEMLKKAIFGTIQLVGVMCSLIGANILSMNLVPNAQVHQKQQLLQQEIIFPKQKNLTNNIKSYEEMCKIDYGCNRNLCWKTCNTAVAGKKLWCYININVVLMQKIVHYAGIA